MFAGIYLCDLMWPQKSPNLSQTIYSPSGCLVSPANKALSWVDTTGSSSVAKDCSWGSLSCLVSLGRIQTAPFSMYRVFLAWLSLTLVKSASHDCHHLTLEWSIWSAKRQSHCLQADCRRSSLKLSKHGWRREGFHFRITDLPVPVLSTSDPFSSVHPWCCWPFYITLTWSSTMLN